MKRIYLVFNIFQKGIYCICIVGIVLTALLALSSRTTIPRGYKIFSVITGSMSPSVDSGSLIITNVPKSEDEIKANIIITFQQPGYQNKFITHRVLRIVNENTTKVFMTKGDSNKSPDGWFIPYGRVEGVYVFHLPYLGHILELIKKPVGLLFLVLIPTAFIIFQELLHMSSAMTNQRFKKLQ